MRDGPIRRALKAVARAINTINLRGTRAIQRAKGEEYHTLGGRCELCAKCCEEPSIQVGKLTWYMPTLRRLFLFWQRRVNGFELKDRIRGQRVFVFTCTHFNPETRRCDSYESRPLMCRDYPRALLFQPNPEFLDGCGYRPIAKGGDKLKSLLEKEGLSEEQMQRISEKLHLGE